MILGAVYEHRQAFRAPFYTGVLCGLHTREIVDYQGVKSSFWQRGMERDTRHWNGVIRQMLVHGLLEKEIETYGVLKITERGMAFLRQPGPLMLVEERDYSDVDASDSVAPGRTGDVSSVDNTLRALLADLRKSEAQRLQLPPYVLFQDFSLDEMAIHYPLEEEELLRISGVGVGKAKKFGAPFLDLIRKYVAEEGIERADDLLIRAAPQRQSYKVQIIQRIDRKMDLEDIANDLKLGTDELIAELERIVSSGTRVNLRYMLLDIMDEDSLEELMDFFRASEDAGWAAAEKAFGDVYAEGELRLVRVQFLSEYAN